MELHFENYDGKEILTTTRTGPALPIDPLPKMNQVKGDINTISTFVNKRYNQAPTPDAQGLQFIDKHRAIVTVDREEFSILLELDPEHPRGASVFGSLTLSPELEKFSINTGEALTRDDLVKLIRFNKIWFADREKADELEKAYMAFKASVYADIKQESDTRGNVDNGYTKKVTTGIPESFFLNIPIFKGQGKRKFLVNINIEATSQSVRFYLESVELHDTIQIESEQILKKQLECCADFVIVYK